MRQRGAETRHQAIADRLADESARYQAQHPAAAEALRIFTEADHVFQRGLAAMDQARIVISDSSYGQR